MIKKVECIVRPSKMDEIKNKLIELGVDGMTVSEVKGFGTQRSASEEASERNSDDFLPRMRIEVVTEEEKIEKVIQLMQDLARTGKMGDGKIFVYPVEDVVRVRTKERGRLAIQ